MPRLRSAPCKRLANRFDIAFAAELADEAAAGFECVRHAFDNFLRLFHPVQRGVGEDRVEAALVDQLLAIHDKTCRPRFRAA